MPIEPKCPTCGMVMKVTENKLFGRIIENMNLPNHPELEKLSNLPVYTANCPNGSQCIGSQVWTMAFDENKLLSSLIEIPYAAKRLEEIQRVDINIYYENGQPHYTAENNTLGDYVRWEDIENLINDLKPTISNDPR